MTRRLLLMSTIGWPLLACSGLPDGSGATPAPVTDRDWQLVELDGRAVDAGAAGAPTLRFDSASGRVAGHSGVNRYSGSYRLAGTQLALGALVGTRMAGPPAAMALEDAYLRMLGLAVSAEVVEGRLQLGDAQGRVLARFGAPR